MIYCRHKGGGEKLEVEFYQTADGKKVIEEFLDSLPAKDLAKVLRDMEVLADYAPDLHEPYTKHIDGPIWELRSKFSSNIYRLFYFIYQNNKLIMLHGFTKKTNRTPRGEIQTAQKRLADYLARNNQ